MNGITVQDQLISKLKKYSKTNRNYYTSVTKAVKQARRELIYLGYEYDVDRMIQDCRDMAELENK